MVAIDTSGQIAGLAWTSSNFDRKYPYHIGSNGNFAHTVSALGQSVSGVLVQQRPALYYIHTL